MEAKKDNNLEISSKSNIMDWPSGRKVLLDCGWQRNSKIPLLTTGPFLSSRSSRIYYLNFDTKLTDGAQANTTG